jgi:thiamine pyrophosphate-dependent acetolactate synthase large subunit-like protein
MMGADLSTSKSAFPEDHPLALGSGGLAVPKTVRYFLDHADVIFGIGCSFTESNFAVSRYQPG